jgi:hypothetical protein
VVRARAYATSDARCLDGATRRLWRRAVMLRHRGGRSITLGAILASLSWVRRRDALIVVMNRDERRSRGVRRGGGAARTSRFTAPVDGEAGGAWSRREGLPRPSPRCTDHQAAGEAPAENRHQPQPLDDRARRRGRRVRICTRRLRHAGLASFAPFRLFVAAVSGAPQVLTCNGVALTYLAALDPPVGFLTAVLRSRAVLRRGMPFSAPTAGHPRATRYADLVRVPRARRRPRGTPWAIIMQDDARTVSGGRRE